MCRKGRYTNLTSSLSEDYVAGNVASFMACRKYDETITVINTSKGYVSDREQNLQQQLVKNIIREKRILVVDDEYDTNLTLKIVLEESGYKVDSFTDPLAALRNFKSGLYDLALIDVKMPGMHGFGLCNEIRKFDIKVKICFLTATEDTHYESFRKQAYPNFEENCIIRKPIENELLISRIKSIIC
ncbi:MAG: response regulator [Thermoproteota archaeon]|nr:response regulator [Thermoproteota archaeon]